MNYFKAACIKFTIKNTIFYLSILNVMYMKVLQNLINLQINTVFVIRDYLLFYIKLVSLRMLV